MRRALRSLTFFWKPGLTVALGAAVAATVLTGPLLLTGTSVRGSLRDLTLERLGGIVTDASSSSGLEMARLAASIAGYCLRP